jgi:Carbohydrate esterase, sialic acid-specific acetylesterase
MFLMNARIVGTDYIPYSILIITISMFIHRFSGYKIRLSLLCLGIFMGSSVRAQLSISFPFDGAVFQRNAAGTAVLSVGGSYTGSVDRIEARLTAMSGGSSIGWTVIHNQPTGGIYSGSFNGVLGGWYTLEVRAILFNNVVLTPVSLSRVGVGEVFVIAGQSNVQGIGNHGAKASMDAQNRVRCIDWLWPCPDGICQNTEPPFPQISTLNSNADAIHLAPNGNTSWVWGELGDLLLSRFNVPVLFFNAAAGGSSVGNWSRSADGLPSGHPLFGFLYAGNPNFPYNYLRKSLNYYASLFGIRAVLWHQGESDAIKNRNTDPNDNTSAAEYADSLQHVISRSRNHSGKILLPWVVAQGSYWFDEAGGPGTDAEVISGQNLTINPTNKIFAGPNSDNIQIPRPDGVHLENVPGGIQGISEFAAGWNLFLDNNFFANTTPYAAMAPPLLTLGCSGNTYSITAPAGYSYFWVNGNNDITTHFSNNQTIYPGAGTYRVYLKDMFDNVVLSQSVVVPALTPQPPTLSVSASPVVAGQSVTLYAQGCSGTVGWSSGQSGYSISQMISQTTTYSATCSIGSCASIPVSIQVSACPANATLSTAYVSGQNLTIKASNALIGTNAVRAGATITYDATKSVTLQPGFLAEKNSTFTALAGVGCTN